MNLELTVQARTYNELKVALLAEADRFYEDRRYGFYNLSAKQAGDYFELTATAFEVEERPSRSSRAAISEEDWDPFKANQGYDPF